MTGFMSSDGGEVAAGLNPNGIGQALRVDANGNLLVADVSVSGRTSTAIAAGTTTATVVKNAPGLLARILVTVSGSAEMDIFDNASTASGTKIGIVPANTSVGTIINCQAPALNGITVGGNAANPGVTLFFS